MTEYRYTTRDLAEKVGLKSVKAVRARAKLLGLGIDGGGRAGYRYTEADLQKLIESMRPIVVPVQRKRKRASA